MLAPVLAGEADIAVGSRFAGGEGYRSSATRRVGIRLLALVVSAIARQRVTDTTSGFQALNRRALDLFAADYPHDYPEVEGMVMTIKHHLTLREVPVQMREREHGRSSITALRSVYYMVKVSVALFVGLFRRAGHVSGDVGGPETRNPSASPPPINVQVTWAPEPNPEENYPVFRVRMLQQSDW